MGARSFVFLLLAALAALQQAACIEVSFDLNASQKKCFGEELSKHSLLVSEFNAEGPISVTVADPTATIFSDKDKNQIKTAFTTNQAGTHMFCVQNLTKKGLNVKMNVAWGAQARDYSQIAKKENLDAVVVGLRRVEDMLYTYRNRVINMRSREERMRQTNDSTSFRVIAMSVLCLVLIVGVGATQLYYFRNFFRSKKII